MKELDVGTVIRGYRGTIMAIHSLPARTLWDLGATEG